jgi:fermentation-respiration switch protein FrsA (DUF1100 family)
MTEQVEEYFLRLQYVERGKGPDGVDHVGLGTDAGVIQCRFRDAQRGDVGVLWVFGAGGGFGGPAGGLYTRLGEALTEDGIGSLELSYRHPGDLVPCALDTLMGIEFLKSVGRDRVILVGHSFGGGVVISVATASEDVIGVAALSTQTFGTEQADEISPRPLLLIHGEEDEILPDSCARSVFERAREPKKLLLYPCRHGLDECREEIDRDLGEWLRVVALAAFPPRETTAAAHVRS